MEQKLYYTIGEAAATLGVAPSVLRFWETEFDQLRPVKNRRGTRSYTARDIELPSNTSPATAATPSRVPASSCASGPRATRAPTPHGTCRRCDSSWSTSRVCSRDL